LFFNLPNSGGSGRANTVTNCAAQIPNSINCTTVSLQIQGPEINNQTANCPTSSSNTALPITLVDFSAKWNEDKSVDLNWLTASEINNDYFTIERSKDGYFWETVEKIPGAGNSTAPIFYRYVDMEPLNEQVAYYRLRQTDFNGQFDFFDIAALHRSQLDSKSIFIYPNPIEGIMTIEGETETLADPGLYSIDGKAIMNSSMIPTPTNNSVTLDLSSILPGTYFIKTMEGIYRFRKV
jgi:hypothetical protein